jgi:hypothetical protein
MDSGNSYEGNALGQKGSRKVPTLCDLRLFLYVCILYYNTTVPTQIGWDNKALMLFCNVRNRISRDLLKKTPDRDISSKRSLSLVTCH